MARTVHPAGSKQRTLAQDPAPARLTAFICVLTLYLGFAGTLIGLGYGLWPALAGATTACVVAGEVARRVISAGTAPAMEPAGTAGLGSGFAELLSDISRALERGGGPGAGGRES
jgi:hypothetical protein